MSSYVSAFGALPSVLWRCWLGGRKGIWPVKNWQVVGCWRGLYVWSKVQTCIWPSGCHCHSLSLASVKSKLVLPYWYRLTWVVPDRGPLNVCVSLCLLNKVPITNKMQNSQWQWKASNLTQWARKIPFKISVTDNYDYKVNPNTKLYT